MDDEAIESMDFSLADLAGVDMSQIAEVSFEGLPAGMYLFRGLEGKLEKVQNAKEENRGKISLQMEVAEVKSITERNQDPDDWLGKKHRENFWIVPEKPEEGLGLAVRFFRSIGINPEGKQLGGTEDPDGNPVVGIIDEFADGFEFLGKITKKPRRGDPTQKDSVLTPIDVRKPNKVGG